MSEFQHEHHRHMERPSEDALQTAYEELFSLTRLYFIDCMKRNGQKKLLKQAERLSTDTDCIGFYLEWNDETCDLELHIDIEQMFRRAYREIVGEKGTRDWKVPSCDAGELVECVSEWNLQTLAQDLYSRFCSPFLQNEGVTLFDPDDNECREPTPEEQSLEMDFIETHKARAWEFYEAIVRGTVPKPLSDTSS